MTDATPLASEQITPETFLAQLRRINTDRYQAWVGDTEDAGILFDAAELGGEVGELLNVVKKLERETRGWRGSRAAPEDFADECADVLICLDKLARRMDVDLEAATIRKFNATSDKVGLPQRLSASPAPSGQGVSGGWQIEDGKPISEAPYACHVLAGRLNEDTGDWIMAVVASPPIRPFTHWWPLPGQLAAPAPSCAPVEVERVARAIAEARHGVGVWNERNMNEVEQNDFRHQARAALRAAALSPQGLNAKDALPDWGEGLPIDDSTCRRCGSAPRSPETLLCATCTDEAIDAARQEARDMLVAHDFALEGGTGYRLVEMLAPLMPSATRFQQGLDAKEGGPKPCSNPACTDSDPVVERVRRWERDASPRRVECQCGAFGSEAATDADAIAAWNATPSQRLDAATVERCAQFVTDGYRCRSCNAVFVEQPSDLIGGGHPDNGCTYPNWDKLTEEQQVAAIRALATEPHQHGAGNGEKHGE